MNDALEAVGATPAPAAAPTKKVVAKKPAPASAKKPVAKIVPATKKAVSEKKAIPDQRTKEIKWTPAKTALLATLKKLGATSSMAAKTPAQIAKASNGKLEENQVNHQVKAAFDLSMQDIIKRADLEEQGRSYYLSAKGLKIASKV